MTGNLAEALEQAERELQIYRECFRATPFPAMIFGADGGLVDVSAPLKELTRKLGIELKRGVTFEAGMDQLREAYGSMASAETVRSWHDGESAARQQALETGTPVEFERFDGGWRLISVLRTQSGFTLDMRTDITEQKRKQAQLAQAEARAKSADRAKSQFLANMSHEIRTPMNGIMGMAELLCATNLTPKQRNFAEIILQSSESLLRIINDVLDFSKIEAGEMELRAEPFNLVEAIEDVALLVSAKAASKNLELAVRFNPDLPAEMIGDGARLRQIVVNLVSNAVKFTEKGYVLINVDGELSTVNRERTANLVVSVEDSGIGVPKDKLGAIFEKFTQVDNSSTRAYEGTGLGLSICKSFVEMMGGEIGVDSIEGQGSKFWFRITLPIHETSSPQKSPPFDVAGARLLIIDDNEVNRSILTEQTTGWRFRAKAASSGEEGLELLKAAARVDAPFDVVILDYQMPMMNGAETAGRIRADPAISDTPIILLTSIDHRNIDAECSALGIRNQLVKPAKASLLLDAIIDAVHRHRDLASRVMARHESLQPEWPVGVAHPGVDMDRYATSKDASSIELLIAEDNEVNKIVYRQILDGCGWSYAIASDGKEALDLIEARKPRVVIMDVSMPVMNGLEAAQELRRREIERGSVRTPIIGVTAHAMSGDMERCIDAGMDDYLCKPISPKRIIEKIEKFMNGRAAERATAK